MGSDLRPVAQQHHSAVLDAHACYLRGEGYTYQQIATEMGCSVSTAHDRVNRAYGRMPGPKALTERNRMLRELDDLKVQVYRVLETNHVTVSSSGVATIKINGQVVPIPDDHPVLEAVDRLLKIQHQRARLTGAYAPEQHEVTHHDGDSDLDREITELLEGMGRLEQSQAPLEAAGEAEPTHP